MKILFAIKALDGVVGGAERVFCTICSELVERGHEIHVLTFDSVGSGTFYWLDARVNKIDLGIGESRQRTSLLDVIRRTFALRGVVSKIQPDLAVGFMHSMFVPMAFALIGKGIPSIGSEHIVPEFYMNRRFQYLLMQVAATCLTKLTVLSESIRLRYARSIRGRMVVMPNPIERATGFVRDRGGKDSFVLLSIGRLTDQKDHATLIRAFALVAPKFPEWHLRIIGEGELRFELESLVMSLSLVGRVSLPGVTSTISMEYESADIFVIASRYEAFGLVTAEAMSYGLPVIGFADCPGTNELVQPEKTGVLVDTINSRVASLGTSLSRLMLDADLRERMGAAGREEITKHYSKSHVCDQWETLINSLVKHA